jgi:4-carboxymuconolactone decarboxylase
MALNEHSTHSETYEAGLKVRREVLGSAYVDRSLASANDFNSIMQDLTTEYCWGVVWTRETLERRERSLINLAMMTALNRPHELALHVRGALNNGLTTQEIAEVFVQCAIYAGIPAALESFKVAQSVFDEQAAQ